MRITTRDLKRWATDSIKQAIKLGYDTETLSTMFKKVKLTILPGLPPEGNWYGWAFYSDPPLVQIYERNSITEGIPFFQAKLKNKKVPDNIVSPLISACRLVPQRILFELVGQSGMDHEIIGHIYNYSVGARHDEQAACESQIALAKIRGGIFKPHWKLIAYLSPIIMGYHKKDEFISNKV